MPTVLTIGVIEANEVTSATVNTDRSKSLGSKPGEQATELFQRICQFYHNIMVIRQTKNIHTAMITLLYFRSGRNHRDDNIRNVLRSSINDPREDIECLLDVARILLNLCIIRRIV